MNKYHVLRVVYNCGADKVPWHMVLHAIRQGLNLDSKTYTLQEKDFDEFPILRGLMQHLADCDLDW